MQQEQQNEKCHSIESILEVAQNHVMAMLEELNDPMVHKAAALMIMKSFAEWHKAIADERINTPEASAWAEDLGKIKAAAQLFSSVKIGSHDFMTNFN